MNEERRTKNEEHSVDEINLLDYWLVIKKYKKLIAKIVGATVIIAVIYSLLLPKIYKSQAVIMPIGGSGGGMGAMLAAQLGGLGGLIGGPGTVTPSQKLMALLNSRALSESVVDELNLEKILFEDKWDAKNNTWKDGVEPPNMELIVNALREHLSFMDDQKNGTIKLYALFKAPELAAQVVGAYIKNLQEFINQNSFTVSKRNRVFIEGQLANNKRELLTVGKELNTFYKEGNVSDIRSRMDVSLDENKSIDLENNISNTAWDNLEKQKEELSNKLARTEIVKDVPQQVYLQYLTLRRELLGKMNALLTQQYEMARIDEAKEDLAFQVIDYPNVPFMRDSPRRSQIVIMSFMASLFLSVFAAFFIEYIKKMKAQQERS